jgi:hypothetical protein
MDKEQANGKLLGMIKNSELERGVLTKHGLYLVKKLSPCVVIVRAESLRS